MEAIILTDDDLKGLETRFGQVVRHMGPWSSDGIFGYESVPMLAVERAAEAVGTSTLLVALSRLRTSERTEAFIELLNDIGPVLVERIATAYRDFTRWPHQSVLMKAENSS